MPSNLGRKDMRLKITSEGYNKTLVELGGEVIPVRSINVDFSLDQVPFVSIELEVPTAKIDGVVRAYLHPAAYKLLVSAGWTPPKEDE